MPLCHPQLYHMDCYKHPRTCAGLGATALPTGVVGHELLRTPEAVWRAGCPCATRRSCTTWTVTSTLRCVVGWVSISYPQPSPRDRYEHPSMCSGLGATLLRTGVVTCRLLRAPEAMRRAKCPRGTAGVVPTGPLQAPNVQRAGCPCSTRVSCATWTTVRPSGCAPGYTL